MNPIEIVISIPILYWSSYFNRVGPEIYLMEFLAKKLMVR